MKMSLMTDFDCRNDCEHEHFRKRWQEEMSQEGMAFGVRWKLETQVA